MNSSLICQTFIREHSAPEVYGDTLVRTKAVGLELCMYSSNVCDYFPRLRGLHADLCDYVNSNQT